MINCSNCLRIIAGTNGTDFKVFHYDTSTQAMETIEYAHHEIHDGSFYSVASFQDTISGASYNFYIKTPATTKYIHMNFDVGVEAECDLKIYEDSTATVWGVEYTPVNHNRNSVNTSGCSITINTSCGDNGMLLWNQKSGSGRKIGGDGRAEDEFILLPNTGYLFSVIEDSGATKWMSVHLHWYEHVDRG